MTTIAEGRPSRATQPKFRRLDAAAIAEAARQPVVDELQAIEDDRERLVAAAGICTSLEPEVERLRKERDDLLLSAAIYDRVRGVNHAAGVGRTILSRLKREIAGGAIPTVDGTTSVPDYDALARAAKKAGLKHRRDALEKLPDVAEEQITLRARLQAAKEIRNDLVVKLVDAGDMAAVEAASIIGTTEGRVSLMRSASA